jgi:CheY-like chemotaxis protein
VNLVPLNEEQFSFSCEIIDTGIGISEEQQQHIFTPFSQADSSTTRKYGGTGLGLTIVKQLCQLMGGDIALKRKNIRGCCFSFNLIFGRPESVIINTCKQNTNIEVVDLSMKKILLVEDNRVNQIVATKQLAELKLKTDIAENGIKALEILNSVKHSAPYDLILMDCQMPKMDGFETSRAIRQGKAGSQHQEIVIIALTANAMKGDKDKCLNSGMNDYLTKPIKVDSLNKKITTWLSKQ